MLDLGSSRQGRCRLAAALLASLLALPALADAALAAPAPLKPRALPTKSILLAAGPGSDPRGLVVKLKDDADVELREGRFVPRTSTLPSGNQAQAPAAVEAARFASTLGAALAKTPGVRVEPLLHLPKPWLDLLRGVGEARSGEVLADLSQYYRVTPPPGKGAALLVRLLGLPEVENAYATREVRHPVDIAPTTRSFVTGPTGQGYLSAAPVGIGLDAATAAGLYGTGVTIADVETNWRLRHEDLDHLLAQVPPVPLVPETDWLDPALPLTENIDHGTASLGVLAGGLNGYGVNGIAPGARFHVVPIRRLSDSNWSALDAVVLATVNLRRGDVLLLEVEDVLGATMAGPFETFDAEFAVVRQATALGIHVVEPAGNSTPGLSLNCSPGSFCAPDFLDPLTGRRRFDATFRDSGAILVGGGQSALGNPQSTSHPGYVNANFGDRVDSYSWAQNVTTLGFGPNYTTLANCAPVPTGTALFPAGFFDPNQWYTACYNGTSSAGAIVAGAVALLEERHRAKWGRPATPREMRNLLRLGTSGDGTNGYQPDLAFHLNLLNQVGTLSHVLRAEIPATLGEPSQLGSALASPGDVDGDGVNDIAAGASAYGSAGQVRTGRVYLFSGKSEQVLWTVDGSSAGEEFGTSLAAVGDVDGDGIGDLAAGAPGNGSQQPGTVYVLSGAGGLPLYSITQGAADERFGAALAPFPFDLDGDGLPEILAGSPGARGGATNQARIDLLSGANGGTIWTVNAPSAGTELGISLSSIGDLDGDGVPEVVAGAPGEPDPLTGQISGAVQVFEGSQGGLLYSVSGGALGGAGQSRFGASASGTGDLNGDGLEDFIAGAPNWTPNGSLISAGRVDLFSASSSGASLLRSYTGLQRGESLGRSVAGIGDWNGDGLLDVAAGQPGTATSVVHGPPPGKVIVYLGPFDVPLTPALARQTTKVFATRDQGTRFGVAVAAMGDVTGDGLPDVGAGETGNAQGRVFTFSAVPSPAEPPAPWLVAALPEIEAADVNNDGFSGDGLFRSQVVLQMDAGPANAFASYSIVGRPLPPFDTDPAALALVAATGNPFLTNFTGTLDAGGRTSLPVFGPIPRFVLCPGLAEAEFELVATVGGGTLSTPARVKIIWEYRPVC